MRFGRPIHLAALALVALAGCRPARPSETRELVPELVMEGVRFQVDRAGETRASGEATRVTYRRDTTDVTASGLGLVLSEAGERPVRIAAPSGQGVTSERRFGVTGGIRAERAGDVATTASATFEPAQPAAGGEGPPGPAQVHGDQPVVVEGEGYRLTGAGFRLDPATREIVLTGGARLVAGTGGRR